MWSTEIQISSIHGLRKVTVLKQLTLQNYFSIVLINLFAFVSGKYQFFLLGYSGVNISF